MPTLEKELLCCEQCGAQLESSSSPLGCVNCLLLGGFNEVTAQNHRYQHYEVCRTDDGALWELGRGAMGVTYRAVDINLDSPVALKVISAHFYDNREARERFRREARVAARLRHPNVASVFHFGETADHHCFYAMELIEGETLEARVRRDGPLPVPMALDVAIQVTRALMAAAPHGLVHRDLKPSNIMLVANDSSSSDALVVKVIDFGLAKAAAEIAKTSDAISAGFSGTPEFASPEQFNAGKVSLDARSDVYSLGATLWYLLCGKAPFTGGASTEFRAAQRHRQPPLEQLAAAKVPAPVVALLRSMLAPNPNARPQSARELLDALRACRGAIEAKPRRRRQLAVATVALALLIAGTFSLTRYLSQRQQTMAMRALPEKSIAVLPFENQSDSKEDVFFADGMQDEVLTGLVKVKELKVVGRSSVMSYRDPTKRNLREIGQQLGVAYVLEASVRRMADRVLLHVNLTDTRDNRQLWAERFDRTLAGAISLQGELATEIAAVLQAKLAPHEKENLEAKSTENPEAYLLYLRARARETGYAKGDADVLAADQLYAQAIALDPKFALAHARRSILISKNYRPDAAQASGQKLKARAEADEALRSSPALGEAHLALAFYFFTIEGGPASALKELAIAESFSPNNGEIFWIRGASYRQQGHWRESIANYQRALDLDPRNSEIAVLTARNYKLVRDWPNAEKALTRALEIEPNSGQVLLFLIGVQRWAGKVNAFHALASKFPPDFEPLPDLMFDQAMIDRDFAGAEKILQRFKDGEQKNYLQGYVALARGDTTTAHRFFEMIRPNFESRVRDHPEDAFAKSELGLVYAHLGRKEDAIRECRRAIDLGRRGNDPFLETPLLEGKLALVYARTGETDQAITLIERLLTTPGAVTTFAWSCTESSIALADLRLRWEWDPLRNDPRFQKILAAPEPKTIY